MHGPARPRRADLSFVRRIAQREEISVFNPWYDLTMLAARSQRAAWLRMMNLAWGISPHSEPTSPRAEPTTPRPRSKAAPAAERAVVEARVSARPQKPADKSPVKRGRKHRKHPGRRNSARH
jgi:hypothetical protein